MYILIYYITCIDLAFNSKPIAVMKSSSDVFEQHLKHIRLLGQRWRVVSYVGHGAFHSFTIFCILKNVLFVVEKTSLECWGRF